MECITNDFSIDLVRKCRNNSEWIEICNHLKEEFKIQFSESGKPLSFCSFKFTIEAVDELISILDVILEYKESSNDMIQLLTETVRALRNYSTNEDTRKYLASEEFLNIVASLLNRFFKENTPQLYKKIILQLLLNILTLDGTVVKKMHQMLYNRVLNYFLKDNIYLYETSALIYNLTRYEHLESNTLISRIAMLYNDERYTNEYLLFLTEKIISEDYFWQCYNSFTLNERLTILGVLKEVLTKRKVQLPNVCIDHLVYIFKDSTNVIFQVTQADDIEASHEASCILEVISHISSEEEYLGMLKDNKDILISAGILLINVHRLGKVSENNFTPIQKLSEVRSPNEETRRNPVFGFKADLVRLIGNLCWKNRKMQDLAREAEVIPVLLDCCNIDAKNPFIIQWVIFAIRNICEKNLENQKLIAGLHQEGTVSSAVLEEMGVTLHADEDMTLRIVPLNK